MEKIKILITFVAIGMLLFVTCKNVSQTDITEKVPLQLTNCIEQYLDFRVDTIIIMYPNTEKTKDYVSLRAGLEVVVSIINNDSEKRMVIFEDDLGPRFYGISQNDTIEFRKFTYPTSLWLKENDSISIGLSDYYFNFYMLSEDYCNIEMEMVDFVSKLKLIYLADDDVKLCISITEETRVIVRYHP